MPAMERKRRTRNGFFPPVVSTQAEKGIRSKEPDRDGAATRKPTSSGPRPMIPLRFFAVGPKRDTAAKPMKNPRVAPARPWTGVPMPLTSGDDPSLISVFTPATRHRAGYDSNGIRTRGTMKDAERSASNIVKIDL